MLALYVLLDLYGTNLQSRRIFELEQENELDHRDEVHQKEHLEKMLTPPSFVLK